ncbi:aldehyde dehydrogenase family protein [Pontibacillus yanchengensis]|uniref:Aldehyde dehydrogenase family protein n=1 Tax=Pontibacillus yanchengensis TaxID=462910 RepID=A0ACC7VK02_9BACI|nr:aldehyde dehydrogenase family protein [Pontibacillus yanchengensis]MYL55298.1 aldehyde dehydrogenase family protein [Pontibacillus yanchengensis]
MTVTEGVKELKNYIGGEWHKPSSEEVMNNLNPANYREVLAVVRQSTEEDADAAIEAADYALASWKSTSSPARGSYLTKLATQMRNRQEELTQAIVKEMGKTYAEAKKEVLYAAGIADFYAGEGRRMSGKTIPSDMPNVKIETVQEPLGVAVIVTPWNFPLSIPTWKIAPAVVSGNTVVLKTSSETPLLGKLFMEMVEAAEFPAGVINQVIGPGRLVNQMIDHPAVQAISFTGSNNVGNKIYQAASKHMKRVHLEMGGKNPLVILKDADLDEAVDLAIKGSLGQAGQACTATGRVIIEADVHDEFVEKLTDRVSKLRVGNGLEDNIDMGPQVNEDEKMSTLELINTARNEGANILLGGSSLDSEEHEYGFFVEPTVITQVTRDMTIAKREVFGPVINVMKATDLDDAIMIANDVDYGLSASVCTKDSNAMVRALNEIEAGLVKANMTTTGTFYQAPFGGYKQSSSGSFKELGREGIDFFTKVKTKYIKTS